LKAALSCLEKTSENWLYAKIAKDAKKALAKAGYLKPENVV